MAASPKGRDHLFTPISHPELRQLDQKSIYLFFRERESYLLRVMDAQISGASLNLITLKASIYIHFLTSFIEREEFGSAVTSFEALTDFQLQKWLEENVVQYNYRRARRLLTGRPCTVHTCRKRARAGRSWSGVRVQ